MNPSRIAGAFALVLLAGAARADSSLDTVVPLVSDHVVSQVEAGAPGTEPGIDAVAADAKERAAIEEYNRERDLQATWVFP